MTKAHMVKLLMSDNLRDEIYDLDLQLAKAKASPDRKRCDEEVATLNAKRTHLWSRLIDQRTAARLMACTDEEICEEERIIKR